MSGAMSKEKIYVSRYTMQSCQGLNSRSHTTEHEGALIRVEVSGVSGYGCLHPWEELGDASLAELLEELKQGRQSRQVRCALHCAKIDRDARGQGVSLFDGINVPDSHATIVGGVDRVAIAVAEGFDTVKLKMGRDTEADLALVRDVYEKFPKLRLRFDFNGVLGSGGIQYFVSELGEAIRGQVDFLEDPCSLGDPVWEELRDKHGVKTAVDRGVSTVGEAEFDYSILKPAVNRVDKLSDIAQMCGRSVVITSYMDHPVGQCYAAYMAGMLDGRYLGLIDKRCGLMTHGLYEPTEFTERLGQKTPQWQAPENSDAPATGLGFDDLLDNLVWNNV